MLPGCSVLLRCSEEAKPWVWGFQWCVFTQSKCFQDLRTINQNFPSMVHGEVVLLAADAAGA